MYLPSFYKKQFEKYAFNGKRAAPFGIAGLLWCKLFVIQWHGHSGPKFTTPYIPIYIPPREESKGEFTLTIDQK